MADAGDVDRARTVARQAEAVARSVTNPVWQGQALAAVAAAMAVAGGVDRAEAVARSITNPDWRGQALAAMVEAAAASGAVDRAETVARSITNPVSQGQALAAVAAAMADAGDVDRAEAVARSINVPYEQAEALVAVAKRCDEPTRKRRLVASAFRVGRWTTPLEALAELQPSALLPLADEFIRCL
jgi:hypothetical protein